MDFLNLNSTKIEGAVRIWTHGTLPSTSNPNPYYGNYVSNYSVTDFIVHNGTGTVSGPTGFNGFIAGAQGFMVLMNDGTATTDNVEFNNSLRSETYLNNQFYRNSNIEGTVEKHRIWLDLSNTEAIADRTLIGYIDGASSAKDRLFDAFTKVDVGQQRIYSIINTDKMIIQGLGLPFSDDDSIPLGVNIPFDGNYFISIHSVDGLFTNQELFIEDTTIGIISSISNQPYSFYAQAGEINDRFILRFKDTFLSNSDFLVDSNDLIIAGENQIDIESKNSKIKRVTVFDVLGRNLFENNKINSQKFQINTLNKTNTAMFIKITLENNQVLFKKYLF